MPTVIKIKRLRRPPSPREFKLLVGENDMKFRYIKTDKKSMRSAYGSFEYGKQFVTGRQSKIIKMSRASAGLVSYFDYDANDFRSFYLANLIFFQTLSPDKNKKLLRMDYLEVTKITKTIGGSSKKK